MNNIPLSKIVRDTVSYTEEHTRGFGRLVIAIDQFKQVIQSNFAVKAKCSYFFKERSKL
jgi:hypothetical protein